MRHKASADFLDLSILFDQGYVYCILAILIHVDGYDRIQKVDICQGNTFGGNPSNLDTIWSMIAFSFGHLANY